MRTITLLGASLLIATPLAFGFTEFSGTCEHKNDYKFTSEDGTIEVKAKCDALWTFSGYADASDTYADGEVSASTAANHNCSGSYSGPWGDFKSYKLKCDGKDLEGSKTSIDIEIKTKPVPPVPPT